MPKLSSPLKTYTFYSTHIQMTDLQAEALYTIIFQTPLKHKINKHVIPL